MDLSWNDVLKLIVLMVVFCSLIVTASKTIFEHGRKH